MNSPSDQDPGLKTTSPDALAADSQERLPYQAPSLVTLHLKHTANSPSGVTPDGPKLS